MIRRIILLVAVLLATALLVGVEQAGRMVARVMTGGWSV